MRQAARARPHKAGGTPACQPPGRRRSGVPVSVAHESARFQRTAGVPAG